MNIRSQLANTCPQATNVCSQSANKVFSFYHFFALTQKKLQLLSCKF